MVPGIYPTLTNEGYHNNAAISRSGIMLFKASPYKYWAEYLNPNRPPKKQTDAMIFGSAFHAYMLEPEVFEKEYIVEIELEKAPPKVLLKNVGRPAYESYKAEKAKIDFINARFLENFEEEAQGKTILTLAEWYILQEMKVAISRHSECVRLIENAMYEQSYFWKDKETGLMLKARPDILHENMIVDLKTCASASSRAYQRAMIDGGYHLQGAMIRGGIKALEDRDIPNVINLCIEKNYPWEIGIKIIDEQALETAQLEIKHILMQMKECFETNIWPSYDVESVSLPAWYT